MEEQSAGPRRLETQVAELRTNNEDLVRVLEDFIHQIKAPIFGAYARANSAVESALTVEELLREMRIIRALCGKARKTGMNIDLFVSLSHGTPVQPQLMRLSQEDLVGLLIETATECELLMNPACHLKWEVRQDSFSALRSADVRVDQDLLEQALRNVIDNAMKYSFENGHVRIHGGLRDGKFHITVENTGIAIKAEDVPRLIHRGWRSDQARLATGEGSGLGLWIVHNIMKAHGGEVAVTPTTADHLTVVRLVFPAGGAEGYRHEDSAGGG